MIKMIKRKRAGLAGTLALGLLMGVTAFAAQLLSPDAFAARFERAFRKASPGVTIKAAGELAFQVKLPDGFEGTVYLDNAYASYRQAPEELDALIKGRVEHSLSMKEAMDAKAGIDLAAVVPVIKDAGYVARTKATMAEQGYDVSGFDLYSEPINEDLSLMYALDTPQHVQYLQSTQVKSLGLGKGALRERSLKNLKGMLDEVRVERNGAFYMLFAGNNYEASMLLDDALWTSGQFDVKGDLVVAAPTRNLVLVTGSADKKNVLKMRAWAREMFAKNAYGISPELFRRRDGRWVTYH